MVDGPPPPKGSGLALVVATWFGAGLSPRAPGTVGSLFSLVLWGPLVMLEAPWWARAVAAVVVFVVGVAASAVVVKSRGEDPQVVVIDEVAGMGVTLLLAAPSYTLLVLGFACFRLFDIWKPWPVSWADQQVGGGLGVMLDDVIAGVYAFMLLSILERWALPFVTATVGALP
jgi:phosphatidylglycerophosphatase A